MAQSATVVLSANRDATIFENNPDNASGAGNGLFAGTNGTGSPRRALVSFDLAAIPAGSTVQSVELTLVLGQYAGSGGGAPGGGVAAAEIGLHRVLSSWTEGETQRREPSTDGLGTMGQGEPAEEGDVTWNARTFSTESPLAWTSPGGDFASPASASLVVGLDLNQPHAWLSTPALVADVQAWVDATGDLAVSAVDLDEWRLQFALPTPMTTAIPELAPSIWLLASLGHAMTSRRRIKTPTGAMS